MVHFKNILTLEGIRPGAVRNFRRKLAIEEAAGVGRFYFPKPGPDDEAEECKTDEASRAGCFLGQFKLVFQFRLSADATLCICHRTAQKTSGEATFVRRSCGVQPNLSASDNLLAEANVIGVMKMLTSSASGFLENDFPVTFLRSADVKHTVCAQPRILGNWKTYDLPGIQTSKTFPLRFSFE